MTQINDTDQRERLKVLYDQYMFTPGATCNSERKNGPSKHIEWIVNFVERQQQTYLPSAEPELGVNDTQVADAPSTDPLVPRPKKTLRTLCNLCAMERASRRKKRNRRNRIHPWPKIISKRHRIRRIESIMLDINGKLNKRWKTNLSELFSVASKEDRPRIEAFIQQINDGEYWKEEKQKIEEQLTEKLRKDPERVLIAKDEGLISDHVYWQFIKELELHNLMPSITIIKNIRQKWNKYVVDKLHLTKMTNLPEGYSGYQLNIKAVVELILSMVMLFGSGQPDDELEFKVSMDGHWMNGKKEILVGLIPMNMGFVVQNEYTIFPIALFEGEEKFDFLKTVLHDITTSLNQLQIEGLEWKDRKFGVKTIVVVDLAGLWSITPLECDYKQPELNKQFCPHCTATCGTAYVFEPDGLVEKRQTLDEALLGCEPKNTIFCGLHCKIRVTERLIKLMGNALHSATQKKVTIFSDEEYSRKNISLSELDAVLSNNKITHLKITAKQEKNITDNFSVDMTGQLRGYELKLLFDSFDNGTRKDNTVWAAIAELEPIHENRKRTFKMWAAWSELQTYLTRHDKLTEEEFVHVKQLVTRFGKNYIARYGSRKVTPYIHLICAHLVDLLREHGSIGRYSLEGFEAHHKFHRRIFQRSTSHRGCRSKISSILQILQRIYRLMLLRIDLNVPPEHGVTFPKLYKFAKQTPQFGPRKTITRKDVKWINPDEKQNTAVNNVQEPLNGEIAEPVVTVMLMEIETMPTQQIDTNMDEDQSWIPEVFGTVWPTDHTSYEPIIPE